MAKNKFKEKEQVTNKPKEKKKKEQEENTKINFNFLNNPQLTVWFGLFLVLFSVWLTFAFASYIINGTDDQSVIESYWGSDIKAAGREIQNIFGLWGALVSHLFLYKWFGLSSILFIPIFFLGGVKLIYKRPILHIRGIKRTNLFFIGWISVLLGFIVTKTDNNANYAILSGIIGFEIANLFDAIIGWGTPLFLLLILGGFIIYYFQITSYEFSKPIGEQISFFADKNTEIEANIATSNESTKEEAISNKEENIPIIDEYNKENNTNENQEDFELENATWEITDKSKPKKDKEKSTLDLDLVIENQEEIFDNQPKENNSEHKAPFETDEDKVIVDDQLVDIKDEDKEKDIDGVLENYDPTLDLSSYEYPTIDLLNEYDNSKVKVSMDELQANKETIVTTLKNYNIGISNIKATIGPTVTLYEIVPEAGVRISKIKSLEDDIALSLSALGIRIIAPMPGKGTIGIEVPNKNKELVSAKSVFATEKFINSTAELPVVFGKTISNEVFLIDLAKMPHLLIAGATGQGKSVGLNILLASLLYKKHPSQLKLVLVDPKKVELSIFNTIEKHFLAKIPNSDESIITDNKKVIHTLNSLCVEMDLRYGLLKEAGCRNIKEYNKKFVERKLNPNNGHRFLPYIVLVIDELADLMITAGKEVENPIARLAQLARAIGIHLVVATQRPSVNVITGIIKANFPARISFKVTSKVDSRTILDSSGAEQLIGQGDMLFSQGADIIRLQCAFIDTPEVDKVSGFISGQRGYSHAYHLPEFDDSDLEDNNKKEDFDPSKRDKMFDEAARVIVTTQQGSTSLLQRRLQLGYNRAGRIIDQLEAAGIVGQFEGSKAREVLVKDLQSLEQLLNDLNN